MRQRQIQRQSPLRPSLSLSQISVSVLSVLLPGPPAGHIAERPDDARDNQKDRYRGSQFDSDEDDQYVCKHIQYLATTHCVPPEGPHLTANQATPLTLSLSLSCLSLS